MLCPDCQGRKRITLALSVVDCELCRCTGEIAGPAPAPSDVVPDLLSRYSIPNFQNLKSESFEKLRRINYGTAKFAEFYGGRLGQPYRFEPQEIEKSLRTGEPFYGVPADPNAPMIVGHAVTIRNQP